MSWEVRTMRSGTSCFNGTLYKKAFLRFWPIWALYGAQWLLMLPLPFLTTGLQGGHPGVTTVTNRLAGMAQNNPLDMLMFGTMSAAVAGVVCAMAVFSYLYSSRSACTMHALPVRREALFTSHYLAGLSFLLLPHLAVYALTVAVEAALGCLDLWPLTQWLLVQSGACLFFYSFAVFCAMFTGHLVALPLFYGILNFLAWTVINLVEGVCYEFLFGFRRFPDQLWDVVYWLTPFIRMEQGVQTYYEGSKPYLDAPSAVAVYAVLGAVFALAALLVYRTRHIESAGDVVAVRIVRPVFRYGFAFCAGLTGGVWSAALLSQDSPAALTFWVVLWGVIGCFAAEMLLKKSFRVLRAWKGSLCLGAAMLVLCLGVSLDGFGFESRVPDPEQVTQVQVWGLDGAPYDSASSNLTLTDPEDIALVTQIHTLAAGMEDQQYDGRASAEDGTFGYLNLSLTYQLAGGGTMTRYYDGLPIQEADLEAEGTLANLANQFTSDRDKVAEMYGFEEMEEGRLVEAYLVNVWNTQAEYYEDVYIDGSAQALWNAMKQDFAEGTIGVRYLLDDSRARYENTCYTDLCFTIEQLHETAPGGRAASETYGTTFTITLTPNASHTLSLLRELGALDDTHVAPAYGVYMDGAEDRYDAYRNPDGSIPEDILYDEARGGVPAGETAPLG